MSAESTLAEAVGDLVVVVEACGAAVIAYGAVKAFLEFVFFTIRRRRPNPFSPVRLNLGRHLALGLEFQLASDVLRSAVSPSFNDIGQLAAIVAIRTVLNYFLSQEIAEERRQVAQDASGATIGKSQSI